MNTRTISYIASGLFILFIAGAFMYVHGIPGQSLNTDLSKVQIGTAQFNVEVAATPLLRAQGLSGREKLSGDSGMLFIFDEPAIYSFWMKEMRFPLDIVWIDKSLNVVDITRNALPESYPETFSPKTPAQYVLEIPGGVAEEKDIKAGDAVTFIY